MPQQIITKTSPGNFTSQWQGISNSTLNVNFNPLIKQHNLSGNFILLHWQAKPKPYRRWAYYKSPEDIYVPFDWDRLKINTRLNLKPIEISEEKWGTVPTAVIYLPNVIVTSDSTYIYWSQNA